MGNYVRIAIGTICTTAILFTMESSWPMSQATAFASTISIDTAENTVLSQSITKAVAAIHAKQSAQQFRNTTDWTLLSLYAADVNGTSPDWQNSAKQSGMDQLEKQIENVNKQPLSFATTDFERVLLGLLAGARNPKSYAHRDWIEVVDDSIRPDGKFADTVDGAGKDLVNSQIWGAISLYAAGVTLDEATQTKLVNWLDAKQHTDGGWNWNVENATSDTDITAMTLVAYHALQVPNTAPHVQKALQYLRMQQNASGGFAGADGTITTETTAAAVEALLAQDIDPTSWKAGTNDPVQYLLQAQLSDGSFVHQLNSDSTSTQSGNDISTAQALTALADVFHSASENHYVTVYDRLRELSASRQSQWIPYADDVQSSSIYFGSIRRMQGVGVVNGYEDGTFRPNNSISRAEFAAMLVRALDEQDQIGPKTTRFHDVPANSWYNPIVKVAYDNDLITGVSSVSFAPQQQVLGAELMTMLVRAMNLGKQAQAIKGDKWYTGYVEVAKQNNILYPDFIADKPATRAQCAAALQQYYSWLATK